MYFRLLSLSGLLLLTSCAYMMEDQIQNVTLETPGAENAVCYMYVNRVKHRVHPPQSLMIAKSDKDMVVDCLAPGNRRQKVVIKPTVSKHIYRNVVNGILPGGAWDYASKAMYKYPDIVTVDFTTKPVRPEDLPAQNRPDVKAPEEYPLEEILPGVPRRNEDALMPPVEIRRREKPGASGGGAEYMIETEGTSTPDKGNLVKAANPAGGPSPKADGPAKVYPGQ